jgi:PEP-CTERM motif
LLCLLLPVSLLASTVTDLNFDSIAVPAGGFTDATAYLNSFGVTFSSSQPGATPLIGNDVGSAITAVSPPNFFIVNPGPGFNNSPLSYTLTFTTPLDSLSFYEAALVSNATYPTWTATAFDGLVPVASVGRPLEFGMPAQLFTLNGPGITSINFSSFSTGQTTDNIPIDDLTLVAPGAATPEPSSLLLLGIGILSLLALAARR